MLAVLLIGAYGQQCAWYTDVWTNGEALWGHAVSVHETRPVWLRGAVSTHALAEYGLQLSWAGKNEEAKRVLERQMALAEADSRVDAWPLRNRLAFTAYAPLALVHRMLGDPDAAIGVADRGLDIIKHALARGADSSEANREAARCVAARALAVYVRDARAGIDQMNRAVEMCGGADAVVMALASQLEAHLARGGGQTW